MGRSVDSSGLPLMGNENAGLYVESFLYGNYQLYEKAIKDHWLLLALLVEAMSGFNRVH